MLTQVIPLLLTQLTCAFTLAAMGTPGLRAACSLSPHSSLSQTFTDLKNKNRLKKKLFCVVLLWCLSLWFCFSALLQVAVGRGTRSPAGPAPTSDRWSPSPAPNTSSTSQGTLPLVRIKSEK